MSKVLISDKMSPRAAEVFKARGITVDVKTGMSPAELEAAIGAYDGLAVRSSSKVTDAVLTAAKKLKVGFEAANATKAAVDVFATSIPKYLIACRQFPATT